MLVVVAAGNYGAYGISSPADAETVLAVGSVTSAGTRSPFSSAGPSSDLRIKPDVVARGSAVVIASGSTSYSTGSGTSYATPLVAGVAALVMNAHRNWTVRMVREAIVMSAASSASPDVLLGFGLVDAVAAIAYSPVLGASCDEYGCLHDGNCSASGVCVCDGNSSWYGPRCEFQRVECPSFCNLGAATCSSQGWCICNDGQSPKTAGVACEYGLTSSSIGQSTSSISAIVSLSLSLSYALSSASLSKHSIIASVSVVMYWLVLFR
jgi:hypothetical protein